MQKKMSNVFRMLLDTTDIDSKDDMLNDVLDFAKSYFVDYILVDKYYKAKSDLKDIYKKYEKEYGELHPRTVEAGKNTTRKIKTRATEARRTQETSRA